MNTLHIGIAPYDALKARTLAIARGEVQPGPEEPKLWFTSIESVARVLSDKNRALLREIAEHPPASLTELAARTGRAVSNLSRTLKTMERHGLVTLTPGKAREICPRVGYRQIDLSLSIAECRPR